MFKSVFMFLKKQIIKDNQLGSLWIIIIIIFFTGNNIVWLFFILFSIYLFILIKGKHMLVSLSHVS